MSIITFGKLNLNSTINFSMEYMDKYTYLRTCIDSPLGRDKIMQFLAKTMTHITVISIIDAIENGNGFDIEQMKRYASVMIDASIEGFFQSL